MDTSLVFGIIFASIVIGLLLFFGIRYIGDMSEMACKSQMGQQIITLENTVKATLSLSRGASQELRLLIPQCFKKICFVDPDHPEENTQEGWEPDTVATRMVVGEGDNVIIYHPDGVVEGKKINKLKPYVNFCIASSTDVIIRNAGALVEITLPGF